MISLLALTAVLLSVTFVTAVWAWSTVLGHLALALSGLLLFAWSTALRISFQSPSSIVVL